MNTAPSEADIEGATAKVSQVFNLFDPIRFRAWAELGLTTGQLRVMFYIRESPGVTAGELAQRLAVTPPTMSGLVDRLEKMGMVRRELDESDRRLVRNHLPTLGDETCSRVSLGVSAYMCRVMSQMDPDDLDALNRGMSALVRANDCALKLTPNLAAVSMPLP